VEAGHRPAAARAAGLLAHDVGARGHPPGVAAARRRLVGRGRAEALGGVLPHRLEQPVVRLAVALPHVDERVVDEAGERAEHVGVVGVVAAHGLDGLDRHRRAEHRQAREQPALGGAQQVVAPVEERA
jgi:hypothetical protein